ncbi:DUF1002 domain-containing protein [Lagierella massiliensis]|uniref:DUF1002 domain-containing protein n=1 Tax=Lagierella massiliensis TaxID=1689303 RepID=UPI000B1542DE|nr:DUF1002 domain-containing protein [Lagierella massiliensis]
MNTKIKKTLAGVFAFSLLFNATMSKAAEIDTEVINERWGKPTFAYGETLNENQKESTMKLLGVKDKENINSIKVTYKDLVKYIGGDLSNPANMISSVLVTKENEGKGVEVEIKTPENITQITAEQYRNAALTAGVEDATILVGAIRPVTGESALTGVYKAFEANGETLDKERMEVAQDELDTVNEISQENKAKEGFDTDKLDEAITDIKSSLGDIKNNQDKQPTLEDIRRVVEESLVKYDLDKVVTQDQMDKLISYFEKYANTDAITSEEVAKQLKKWGGAILDGAKQAYDEAEKSGLLDQISAFLRDVFGKIVELFK